MVPAVAACVEEHQVEREPNHTRPSPPHCILLHTRCACSSWIPQCTRTFNCEAICGADNAGDVAVHLRGTDAAHAWPSGSWRQGHSRWTARACGKSTRRLQRACAGEIRFARSIGLPQTDAEHRASQSCVCVSRWAGRELVQTVEAVMPSVTDCMGTTVELLDQHFKALNASNISHQRARDREIEHEVPLRALRLLQCLSIVIAVTLLSAGVCCYQVAARQCAVLLAEVEGLLPEVAAAQVPRPTSWVPPLGTSTAEKTCCVKAYRRTQVVPTLGSKRWMLTWVWAEQEAAQVLVGDLSRQLPPYASATPRAVLRHRVSCYHHPTYSLHHERS